jgi:hypothetical protein
MPVIADESHMFGGHSGQGWKKLDTLAMHLKAPLFLLSATPQYNDAERVYCIAHVLDPLGHKGGYLEFLYTHCNTRQNPFSMQPDVEGFKHYASAEEFLAAMPHVYYLPDELTYTIDELTAAVPAPAEFDELNYDRRRHRIMASQIEKRHAAVNLGFINDNGLIRDEVFNAIQTVLTMHDKVLVYATHATVARALYQTLRIRLYIIPSATIKRPARKIILRRLPACESSTQKVISTHIAHGLKPSITPSRAESPEPAPSTDCPEPRRRRVGSEWSVRNWPFVQGP